MAIFTVQYKSQSALFVVVTDKNNRSAEIRIFQKWLCYE